MMHFKAFDQRTEYFIWGICINPDDINKMKKNSLHIPLVDDMKNCKELVFLYHNSKQETKNFIDDISTEHTKFYGSAEDYFNE